MSRHYAVISIGTNSTRVLLADIATDPPRIALALSIGTRIGEGLGDVGSLGEEPMHRTLEAVRSHVQTVRGHYLKLFAIATSAVRGAGNGAAFAARVSDAIGVPVHILSGDDEAAAAYRGAIESLGPIPGERAGVIDCGGGSTEFAIGNGPEAERTQSCEIGAVRLTESIPELAGHAGEVDAAIIAHARELAASALAPLRNFPAVARLVLTGGSATNAAAVIRGSVSRIASYPVTRDDLTRTLARLCGLGYKERKAVPGIKPQRADILPAGIIVLEAVLDAVGHDTATISSADLLLGFLLQQRDLAARR